MGRCRGHKGRGQRIAGCTTRGSPRRRCCGRLLHRVRRTYRGRAAGGVGGREGGHDHLRRVDEAALLHLTKLTKLVRKGPRKQTGAHRVGQAPPLGGLIGEVSVVGPKANGPAHAGGAEGPRAVAEVHLETERSLSARPERGDGRHGREAPPVRRLNLGVEPAQGHGRFVHHLDLDFEDVLVVVVDLHANREQPHFDRIGTGTVLVGHRTGLGHAVLECGAAVAQPKPMRVSLGSDQSTAATVW